MPKTFQRCIVFILLLAFLLDPRLVEAVCETSCASTSSSKLKLFNQQAFAPRVPTDSGNRTEFPDLRQLASHINRQIAELLWRPVDSPLLPRILFENPSNGREFFQEDENLGAFYTSPELLGGEIHLSLPALEVLHANGLLDIAAIVIYIVGRSAAMTHEEAMHHGKGNTAWHPFLSTRWQAQAQQKRDSWTWTEEDLKKALADVEPVRMTLPGYRILLRSDDRDVQRSRLTDKEWFQNTILRWTKEAQAYLPGQWNEMDFAQALDHQWRRELIVYPFELGFCGYGHRPVYVYYWVNDHAKVAIPVGPEEVKPPTDKLPNRFGLLTEAEAEGLIDAEKKKFKALNDAEPQLETALKLLRQPKIVQALLAQPVYEDAVAKCQLLGFALAAQNPLVYVRTQILGYHIRYRNGASIPLSREHLDLLLKVLRDLINAQEIDVGAMRIPTPAQIHAARLTLAALQGRKDKFTLFSDYAPMTAKLSRQLLDFWKRKVAIMRSLGAAADPHRHHRGKPLHQLRTFYFGASGTAHGADALVLSEPVIAHIGGPGQGIQVDTIEIHDIDASQAVLDAGRTIMEGRRWSSGVPVNYHQHHFNLKDREAFLREVPSGTVDFWEDGQLNDLDAVELSDHFRQLNRVLDVGSYGLLTMPNNASLRWALNQMGFDVLSEPDAELRFAAGTVGQLAPDDALQRQRLKMRLQDSGYILIVKRETVHPWQGRWMENDHDGYTYRDANNDLIEDPEVLAAFDAWRRAHQTTKSDANRATNQPEFVDIAAVLFNAENPQAAIPTSITHEEILKLYPDFSERIKRLARAAEAGALNGHEARRAIALRDLYQSQFSAEAPTTHLRENLSSQDLYAEHGFAAVLSRKEVRWAARRVMGLEWQPSDSEDDEENEEPKHSPAIDVATRQPLPETPKPNSLWFLFADASQGSATVDVKPTENKKPEADAEVIPWGTHRVGWNLPGAFPYAQTEMPGWERIRKALTPTERQIVIAKNLLLKLYINGVLFDLSDVLLVHDIVTTCLSKYPDLQLHVLDALGITDPVIENAKAAKAIDALARAKEKEEERYRLAIEYIQKEIGSRGPAKNFNRKLADDVIALYDNEYDDAIAYQKITTALEGKGLKKAISAQHVIQILRSQLLIPNPGPAPTIEEWTHYLGNLLDDAVRKGQLDEERWHTLLFMWGKREGRPVRNQAIFSAAAEACKSSSGLTQTELNSRFALLAENLNVYYLLDRHCAVVLAYLSGMGKSQERKIMIFDLDSKSQINYRIAGSDKQLTFYTAIGLHYGSPSYITSHIPVQNQPRTILYRPYYLSVAEEYVYFREHNSRVRHWIDRLFPQMNADGVADQLMADAREILAAKSIADGASAGGQLAAPRIKSPLERFITHYRDVRGNHLRVEAMRNEEKIFFGLLHAMQHTDPHHGIPFRALTLKLPRLDETRSAPITYSILLNLMVDKVCPTYLVNGQLPFATIPDDPLIDAFSKLDETEWKLLIRELVLDNENYLLQRGPNNLISGMTTLTDADRGRLGPYTAHRLSKFIDEAMKKGEVNPADWDVLVHNLTQQLGSAPSESVKNAATNAMKRDGDTDLRYARYLVLQFVEHLNADYLAPHNVLVVNAVAFEKEEHSCVLQTDPNQLKTYTIAGRPEIIRIHTFDRFLANTVENDAEEASSRDEVIFPKSIGKKFKLNVQEKISAQEKELSAWKAIWLGPWATPAEGARHAQAALEEKLVTYAVLNILENEKELPAQKETLQQWIAANNNYAPRFGFSFVQNYARDSRRYVLDHKLKENLLSVFHFWNVHAHTTEPFFIIAEALTNSLASLAINGNFIMDDIITRALELDYHYFDLHHFEIKEYHVDKSFDIPALSHSLRTTQTPSQIHAISRILRRRRFNLWFDVRGSVITLHESTEPHDASCDTRLSELPGVHYPQDFGGLFPSMIGEMRELAQTGKHAEVRALWRMMPMPAISEDTRKSLEDSVLEILGVPKKDPTDRAIEDLEDINLYSDAKITRDTVNAFADAANSENSKSTDQDTARKKMGVSCSVTDIQKVLETYELVLPPEQRKEKQKQLVSDIRDWLQKSFENNSLFLDEWNAGFEKRIATLFPKIGPLKSMHEMGRGFPQHNAFQTREHLFQIVTLINSALAPQGWAYFVEGSLANGHAVWDIRLLPIKAVQAIYTIHDASEKHILMPEYELLDAVEGINLCAYHFGYGWHTDYNNGPLAKIKNQRSSKDLIEAARDHYVRRELSYLTFDYLADTAYDQMKPEQQHELSDRMSDIEEIPLQAFCETLLRPGSRLRVLWDKTPPEFRTQFSQQVRHLYSLAFVLSRYKIKPDLSNLFALRGGTLFMSLLAERSKIEGLSVEQALRNVPVEQSLVDTLSPQFDGISITTLNEITQEIINENFLATMEIEPNRTIQIVRHSADSPIPLRPALQQEFLELSKGIARQSGQVDMDRYNQFCAGIERALGLSRDLRPQAPSNLNDFVQTGTFLDEWSHYAGSYGYLLGARVPNKAPPQIAGLGLFLTHPGEHKTITVHDPRGITQHIGRDVNYAEPIANRAEGDKFFTPSVLIEADVVHRLAQEDLSYAEQLPTQLKEKLSPSQITALDQLYAWWQTFFSILPATSEMDVLRMTQKEVTVAFNHLGKIPGKTPIDFSVTISKTAFGLAHLRETAPLRRLLSKKDGDLDVALVFKTLCILVSKVPILQITTKLYIGIQIFQDISKGNLAIHEMPAILLLLLNLESVDPAKLTFKNIEDFLAAFVPRSNNVRPLDPDEWSKRVLSILRENWDRYVLVHSPDEFEIVYFDEDETKNSSSIQESNPSAEAAAAPAQVQESVPSRIRGWQELISEIIAQTHHKHRPWTLDLIARMFHDPHSMRVGQDVISQVGRSGSDYSIKIKRLLGIAAGNVQIGRPISKEILRNYLRAAT